eukprot:TRINITY_DN27524_c0_g1_i1.p1 TRINITY_DN27524_c0_g1~~TRINITY_DN27524_c0_g1_i1.p1  ORF type:complete len:412 (-),score=79.85 TRINITY_DN27524_c0_g1_i1:17-1252(-)
MALADAVLQAGTTTGPVRIPVEDVVQMADQRFSWEPNDKLWVMGPIGDSLLKKLQAKRLAKSQSTGSLTSTSKPPPAASTIDVEKQVCRPLHCRVKGVRCQRYDPVIFIPETLATRLEIANNVMAAARNLLEKAGPQFVPGLLPQDLVVQIEDPPPGVHCPLFDEDVKGFRIIVFELRDRFVEREMEKAGISGKEACQARLKRMRFAANMHLLPQLEEWCHQYHSVKASLAAEKVRAETESKVLAQHRRKEALAGSSMNKQAMEVAGAVAEEEAHVLGKKAAKSAENSVGSAVCICRCGYAEAWHVRAPGLGSDVQEPVYKPKVEEPKEQRSEYVFHHGYQSTEKKLLASSASVGSLKSETQRSLRSEASRIPKQGAAQLVNGRIVLKGAGASLIGIGAQSKAAFDVSFDF